MHNDITTEEARATLPAPQLVLARSGFNAAEPLFAADLRACTDLVRARETVAIHGSRLWTEGVRTGLSGPDDRPLYWARLVLASRLRTWRPNFPLSETDRAHLLHVLEVESRGITDIDFPPGERWVRIVVTGFDPFHLDDDPGRSNPSGTAALDLHGWTFPVGRRTAMVRTAIFPVRWADFDDGIVEEALTAPHHNVDAVITLSRGRKGRFDLEVWNGRWRGGGKDNVRAFRTGPVPTPGVKAPEWTRSSLPLEALAHTAQGRCPVVVNTRVTEVPPGKDDPVERADGPTAGSASRRGGGGDYLSNEIAYRNTLLRDRAGRHIPAGHIHLPEPGENEGQADLLTQVRSMVEVVAASVGGTSG